MTEQRTPAGTALREAVRELIRESGLKQAFIARQIGITEKHMSQLLLNKAALTIEWAEKIVDVCRKPLRIDLTPTEWVRDVVTYRERFERVREMHDRTCNLRQAVREHPEGTFTGVTCEMCDVLDLTPATPGGPE